MEVVKAVVAAVEKLRSYLSDGFHCSCRVDAYGVLVVYAFEKSEEDTPVGCVIVHLYLLCDYPLFLCDCLFCEIRLLNETEEYFQGRDEVVRA